MFSNALASKEVYHHIQAGGGGWGDPLERDPDQVRFDVRNEKVSTDAARSLYGVVLTADLQVAEEATTQLRAKKRGERR